MIRRRVYVQNMRHLLRNRMARRRLGGVYVAKRSIYASFTGEARITRIHVNAQKDAPLTGQNNNNNNNNSRISIPPSVVTSEAVRMVGW